MSRYFNSRLITALILIAVAAFARGSEVVRPLPACSAKGFTDEQALDWQRYKGKVMYVDFWASWCPTCAQSFPFLNQLSQQYATAGLTVIGINVDEKRSDAVDFLRKIPATFSIAADASGACAKAFNVPAMPASFLVDRAGNIRHMHLGYRPKDQIAITKAIELLLAETHSSAVLTAGESQ